MEEPSHWVVILSGLRLQWMRLIIFLNYFMFHGESMVAVFGAGFDVDPPNLD